ncbi:MAG TPA: 50S ribosomal protein L19, partial [Reyranellaceae bacterium]|nr:50S ribosomal protein L19 [Reyranellaceae bacterium]
ERIQEFRGTIIRLRKGGNEANFTVRRTASHGIGVERTFLMRSPRIEKLQVFRSAKVRRAQLYYLRDLRGKASRIAEDVEAQRELIAVQAEEAEKRPRREKLKKEKPKEEKATRAAKGGAKA